MSKGTEPYLTNMRMLLDNAYLNICKERRYRGARQSDVNQWLADYIENSLGVAIKALEEISESPSNDRYSDDMKEIAELALRNIRGCL